MPSALLNNNLQFNKIASHQNGIKYSLVYASCLKCILSACCIGDLAESHCRAPYCRCSRYDQLMPGTKFRAMCFNPAPSSTFFSAPFGTECRCLPAQPQISHFSFCFLLMMVESTVGLEIYATQSTIIIGKFVFYKSMQIDSPLICLLVIFHRQKS